MRINSKQLIGLPVETQGGVALGKVGSVDVETETGKIAALHVKTRGVIPGLMDEELLIDWTQIVEITAKRVVVADTAIPEGSPAFANGAPGIAMGGAQMSERGEV
jgi:sporulation protein YlmC with PRC-barrel domain